MRTAADSAGLTKPANTEGAERLLKTDETAQIFGITRVSLARWRMANAGPPYVVLNRRHVRYRASDVQAYIDAQRVDPMGGQS